MALLVLHISKQRALVTEKHGKGPIIRAWKPLPDVLPLITTAQAIIDQDFLVLELIDLLQLSALAAAVGSARIYLERAPVHPGTQLEVADGKLSHGEERDTLGCLAHVTRLLVKSRLR